ncbi:MAG: hypothetical protein AB8G15_18655 [Saprospiraceae bacterium]
MSKKLWILIGLANLFLLSACDKGPEEIPAYIHLEPFELTTNADEEGSAAEKITEAWLFVDDQSLGAYSLPATVPVLVAGAKAIKVFPGIRQNGVSSEPDIYPFYLEHEEVRTLVGAKVDTIYPKTTYSPTLTFAVMDNFDLGTVFREDFDGSSETAFELVTGDEAFEGKSGKVTLTRANPLFEVGSDVAYAGFPANFRPVFLELNYKTSVIIEVGLRGYSTIQAPVTRYERGVNAKDTWNKIYFNLTAQVTEMRQEGFLNLQVVFRAFLPVDQEEGTIYLDNIKLVHE